MDKQNPSLIPKLTLLLVLVLILLSIRPTSKATATFQRDTSRIIIIREIYAVDKKIDSLRNIYSDSIGSSTTTESLLSILRQYDQGNKSTTD
jgi:hypothetical protein